MKICIGIPTTGEVKMETMISIITMIWHTRLPFLIAARKGCYVHDNREWIVKYALQNECTHLLFVDSDMKFPQDTLTRLLAHGKDIIGAAYNGRSMPRRSLVMRWDEDNNLVPINDLPKSVFKCAAVPTGMMLIDCNVFKRVEFPRFFFELNTTKGEMQIGEDVYFCLKAAEKGCKVWCDPTIDVKHIGDYEY